MKNKLRYENGNWVFDQDPETVRVEVGGRKTFPKHPRHITEKELKLAAKHINLQRGVIEHLINAVRENQSKHIEE